MLRGVFQAAVVAVVVAFGLWLWNNLQTNAETTNIPLSFDYLDQPADLTVPGNSFNQSQSVRDAIEVGFGNTIRVALAGIVAQAMVLRAYRKGQASYVAPLSYSRLIFACALGMIFFAEDPDAATWIGAGVIVLSGIYTARRAEAPRMASRSVTPRFAAASARS